MTDVKKDVAEKPSTETMVEVAVEKKPAKLPKAAKVVKEVISDDSDDIFTANLGKQEAFFISGNRKFELKPIDGEKVKNQKGLHPFNVYNRNRGIYDPTPKIDKEKQTYHHVILNSVLYVIDNASGVMLSENLWLNENDIEYVNEDYSNIPSRVVVLERSSIRAGYLNIEENVSLEQSTIKANYNIFLRDSKISNTTVGNTANSVTVRNATLTNCFFKSSDIYLDDLRITDYNINAKNKIFITEIQNYRECSVRVYGENILSFSLNRKGHLHDEGNVSISYYGDKGVEITSMARVDNGYFMGSRPIPFIKTRAGLLANGVEFEYDKFKKFIDDCLWQLKPRSNSEESSSSGFRFCPPNRIGEEDTNGNILSALNAIAMGGNPSVGEDPSPYRQIDPKLTLVNGQIALLAEQIFSRLRLYRELSAIL